MARQISAQLDTRTAKLELLIREADEKIAAMKSAGVRIAESPASIEVKADGPSPGNPAPSPAVDSRHAEIYALADTGRGPTEIAEQLGRPRGEIELILALRPRSTT
jgi:hypothetical protein